MKQIYKALDWLGDYYNLLIILLFVMSIIILILNNLPEYSLIKYYENDTTYNIGNGIWNNILTGLIGSSIFYWIVQYFPQKRKEKISKSLINNEISLVLNDIDKFLNDYLKFYLPNKDISNIEKEDFNKIKFLQISKIVNDDITRIINNTKTEMTTINNFVNNVSDNLDSIIKNPYVNNLPELLIIIYTYKENDFKDLINMLFKNYSTNTMFQTYPENHLINDFRYTYSKWHESEFVEFLKCIYTLREGFRNFTSSISKQ